MVIAHSKLTAQGQISVPAQVRRKLGIGPGSVLESENIILTTPASTGGKNRDLSARSAWHFLHICRRATSFSSDYRVARPWLIYSIETLGATTVTAELTMVGLTTEQRQMLIDKLPDTANLALGALAFGQFLSDRPVSLRLAAGGLAIWLVFLGWGLLLGRRR